MCHISTAAYLNAPTLHQEMPLDCESAALAVALQTRGFALTQNWVFDQLPKQPQRAVVSRGRPVAWGDPYAAFVGNVDGSETNYTGYGVYYPPIAAAAARAGATTDARTGWTTSTIELQIQLGHPVVVWTNFNFAYSGTNTWTAWDGRVVPYTTAEHAVTVIGFELPCRHGHGDRRGCRSSQDDLHRRVFVGHRDIRRHGRRRLVISGDRRLRGAVHVRR